MILRMMAMIGLVMLTGCASERHFAADMVWPFGNPNAPPVTSESAERALGKSPEVTPIAPQAGDVWPGPVQPMPTLSEVQKDAILPLGQGYTPSLPSPYPPGETPPDDDSVPVTSGPLYSTQPAPAPASSP